MKNTKKVIACLYASIVAATALAEPVTFNGERTINGHEYLEFQLFNLNGQVRIDNLRIDENKLKQWLQNHNTDNVEITLQIPGKDQSGREVSIKDGAFSALSSKSLKIKLHFIETDGTGAHLPGVCSFLFSGSKSLTEVLFNGINSTNVTDASCMFEHCENLKAVDLSNFNASNVTDMHGMFDGCNNLNNLDLSSFNTDKVRDMSYMFFNCKNLADLTFNTGSQPGFTTRLHMFSGCRSLNHIRELTVRNPM